MEKFLPSMKTHKLQLLTMKWTEIKGEMGKFSAVKQERPLAISNRRRKDKLTVNVIRRVAQCKFFSSSILFSRPLEWIPPLKPTIFSRRGWQNESVFLQLIDFLSFLFAHHSRSLLPSTNVTEINKSFSLVVLLLPLLVAAFLSHSIHFLLFIEGTREEICWTIDSNSSPWIFASTQKEFNDNTTVINNDDETRLSMVDGGREKFQFLFELLVICSGEFFFFSLWKLCCLFILLYFH